MPTFVINIHGVTVTDDRGDRMTIANEHPRIAEAVSAVMTANWNEFKNILLSSEMGDLDDMEDAGEVWDEDFRAIVSEDDFDRSELEEDDDDDDISGVELSTLDGLILVMKGLIDDELVSASDLGIDVPDVGDNDLSQWNGSPIYYDNEDEARTQAANSMGFWQFHDFGTNTPSPLKYRYATVPTGFGPTAPEGYDWVCLKRS